MRQGKPIPNSQSSITIDAIYFKVKLKNQGGYFVLDLKSGIPITRRKVTDILVKHLFIEAVGNIKANNKITTLKFENKSEVLLHTNYWLTGVDYEDTKSNESEDINDDEQN